MTSGLVRTLELEKFNISGKGLEVTGDPTFEDWQGLGEMLALMEKGVQFAIGDWLAWGEGTFGEKAAQVVDAGMFAEKTCAVYRWVSTKIPVANRRTDLSFSHHLIVAELEHEKQREWLDMAATPGADGATWSVAHLREQVAAKSEGGHLRWLVVVECEDEAARERLATRLESDGHSCKRMESASKGPRKPGPITARKRRK